MSRLVFDDFFFQCIQLLEVINSNFGSCIALFSERLCMCGGGGGEGGKMARTSLETWPQKTLSSFARAEIL